MEETKWICTITLSDGTVIKDTVKEGFDFTYEGVLDRDIFENNCSSVTFDAKIALNHTTQKIIETFNNLELGEFYQYPDACKFNFKQLSEAELQMKKLQADIDFLLMMNGLEE